MRVRQILSLLLALAMLAPVPTVLVSAPAMAQEADDAMPPMPRPRPDRGSQPPAPSASGEASNPASEAIASLTSAPQPVQLSARITQEGAPIPDGLVWRIFDTTPDASGELALVAKSEGGAADVELPPGEYGTTKN